MSRRVVCEGHFAHPVVLGPMYTLHEEVYIPQVRTMASEFERLGRLSARRYETVDFVAVVVRRRTRLANGIKWAIACMEAKKRLQPPRLTAHGGRAMVRSALLDVA